MQINITNGTLTQIQETLTANSGYTLPTTISVSGATSNYNSTTGAITLTNLTQTMSITASGESQATGISNIFFGNSQMASAYYGNSEISSIWYGNTKIYEKGSPTPSGYTIYNNNFNWQYSPGNMGSAGIFKFKINGSPTDDNDYDYFIQDRGYGLQPVIHQRVGSDLFGVDKIPTIENVETIYYWGKYIQGLSINNVAIIPTLTPNYISITYDNSYTYTLDSDITSIILKLTIYD